MAGDAEFSTDGARSPEPVAFWQRSLKNEAQKNQVIDHCRGLSGGTLKAIAKLVGGRFLADRNLNRLALHSALQQMAWGLLNGFSAVFLLRQGLPVSKIFLCFSGIIALRCAIRPAVLASVRGIGLRSTLILGTSLYAAQGPLLASVHGIDFALFGYCLVAAVAQAFYWTSYHAIFAALGESDDRGSQVGWRELLIALAGAAGPAAGGIMLTFSGPWAAFGAAALVEVFAVLPLKGVIEPKIALAAAPGAYSLYRRGIVLLGTDGWIFNISGWAWSLIMFQALRARYDTFGGSLALLALVGAASGLLFGRLIDLGHARRATVINALTLSATLVAKAVCGIDALSVLAVALSTAALGGLYVPSLMTAIYNEAKASACPFRFHFAAEMGWDIGGIFACLAASALCAFGVSLQTLILLALPIVALQAFVLDDSYAERKTAVAAPGTELPGR